MQSTAEMTVPKNYIIRYIILSNNETSLYYRLIERNSLACKLCPARMVSRLGNCLNEGPGEIAMSVKMPPPCGKTERPREASLQLGIGTSSTLLRIGGRL